MSFSAAQRVSAALDRVASKAKETVRVFIVYSPIKRDKPIYSRQRDMPGFSGSIDKMPDPAIGRT